MWLLLGRGRSESDSVPDHRQLSHAPQERVRLIGRCEPVGEAKTGEPRREDLQRDAGFESCERRADAVMNAATKGQIWSDASAIERERVRVGVVPLVAIRGEIDEEELLTGRDGLTEQLGVARRDPPHPVDRRVAT